VRPASAEWPSALATLEQVEDNSRAIWEQAELHRKLNKAIPVLNRLMVQASTFADSRIHIGQYITCTVIPAAPLVLPLFRSLTEARVVLDEFMRWMFYLANDPEPSPVPTIRETLEQALKDWLRSFSHLLPCAEAKLEAQDL
jgi:hypothetical protein